MKILHLISVHQWTGPANYVVELLKYLKKHNCEVLVGFRNFYEGVFKEHLINEQLNFTETLKFPRGFKPSYILKDYISLKKVVEEFRPDIIHCHNSIENILSVFLKKSNKSFKLIRSIHNVKSTKKKFMSSYLLNCNDYIITNCSDFRDRLIAEQNIFPNKVKIIKGFVNENKFNISINKNFLSEKFGVNKNSLKIGMVARFQPHRGQKILIEAFCKLIKDGHSNIKLILVGRGEELENLKKYVKKINQDKNIIFTGYIKDNLPDLLNSLDVFVLLQEGSDGSCRAVLEAMACGLPVVTVFKGALKDTVVDGYNGLFIESKESVNDLYLKLKKMINNKSLRNEMGSNSRKLIEKKFSMEKQLKKYYDFYREIT